MTRSRLNPLFEPVGEPPNAADYAAVLVAIDLVELGRDDEAKALLAAEAPRRLNRECPVCGAMPGQPCIDAELQSREVDYDWYRSMRGRKVEKYQEHFYKAVPRIVPHESRVLP